MPTANDFRAETTENTATALPAVALNRVSRLYGSFVALREITLSLPAGSSVVMLGENGAGKSTLLKVIAGLQSPSYGTVSIFGEAPRDQRGRIAYMSHSTMLYDELTGIENLTYFGSLHTEGVARATLREKAAEALIEVGLDPANDAARRRVFAGHAAAGFAGAGAALGTGPAAARRTLLQPRRRLRRRA
jgi:ABC-type multidrug transport system ATPase subunit